MQLFNIQYLYYNKPNIILYTCKIDCTKQLKCTDYFPGRNAEKMIHQQCMVDPCNVLLYMLMHKLQETANHMKGFLPHCYKCIIEMQKLFQKLCLQSFIHRGLRMVYKFNRNPECALFPCQ